jgi:hypothetical protein
VGTRKDAGGGWACGYRPPGGNNGGGGRLTSGAIVAVVHVVVSHPCPTSPPQTARVGIARAERAKDVGSFVAEDFATSMLHSWSFKTNKPGGST